MISNLISNEMQCEYADKSIFTSRDVYLNYKGLLYVSLGTIDNHDLSDRLDTCLITDSQILVLLDVVPGYGKSDTNEVSEIGTTLLVSTYALDNSDCALKKKGNNMRPLCECGCMGDKKETEVYAREWYRITSDDELTEKSIWLSEV